MKNLLIILVLISTSVYSQSYTELSHKYFVLKEDKTDWVDSIVSDTKFEISAKVINYINGKEKKSFTVMSSDDELSIDNGDTIFRTYCKDSKNNEVEILFMTSKDKERYIYLLTDYKSICFQID